MMGKNHVLCSLFAVAGCASVCGAVIPTNRPNGMEQMILLKDVVSFFIPKTALQDIPHILACIAGLFTALAVGSIFPDIDNKKSTLGKIVHIPLGHRTWTHCIAFLALLSPLLFLEGYSNGFTRMFWVGCFFHIFFDSFSAGGVCWGYPFQRYREYNGGARVAKGHYIKMYHTAGISESWFVWLVLLSNIICIVYFGVMSDGIYNLKETVQGMYPV